MLKDEISKEKDAIKKRLDMLKDFYQKQKDMLKEQYDEENYLRDQQEKRKKVADILAQLAQLEYDDSAWAQKRKLELQEELSKAQQDLDDFERDHALEVAQDELDKLYEMQEEELNNQLDLLEEHENDAQGLYQQALEDIKNGSIELYEEMMEWNKVYGDGIEETVKNAWENAYKALQDYMDLYGEWYKGVQLANATGYTPTGSWDDHPINTPPGSGSGTSSSAPTPGSTSSGSPTTSTPPSSSSTSYPYGKASETTGILKKGSSGKGVQAIQYALNMLGFTDNNGKQLDIDGKFGNKTYQAVLKFQKAMNMDNPNGKVGDKTRKKFKEQGYRYGTAFALPGIRRFEEEGTETVFQTVDGNRYRMFTGGEKVLNAKASDFLYKFATNGSELLSKLLNGGFGKSLFGITPPIKNYEINMGDIIVEGNASQETVSSIRRAQRDSVEFMLTEFNKLSKF